MISKAVRNWIRKATFEELSELEVVVKAFKPLAKARANLELEFPEFCQD